MDKLTAVRRLESLRVAVFTPSQVSALLGKDIAGTRVMLSRLTKDGVLIRVKRGHYCLPSAPVLSVASSIYSPSYVSLWAALDYYGTTTQSPKVIDVMNTDYSGKRGLSIEEGKFTLRFVRTKESFIYGVDKVYLADKAALIADKEKAVVDGLLFNRYLPLNEVVEAIRDGVEVRVAIVYANRSGKQVAMKRLGYLLSQEGFHCSPDDFHGLSDTYVPLDPTFPRKGDYDSEWRIIDNRRQG